MKHGLVFAATFIAMQMCLLGNAYIYAQEQSEVDAPEEVTIWEAMGDEAVSWAENFDVDQMEHLVCREMGEALIEYSVSDPQLMQDAFDALDEITVLGSTDIMVTDAGDVFCFTAKDGTTFSIEFSMSCLLTDEGIYETYHAEDLWDLAFDIAQENEDDGMEPDVSEKRKTILTEGMVFDELPLIDTKEYSVLASCEDDTLADGYIWELIVTNHMQEPVIFTVGESAVNGCMTHMTDCELSGQTISAGSSAQTQIVWERDQLEQYGIQNISDIMLELAVFQKKEKKAAGKLSGSGIYTVGKNDKQERVLPQEPVVWEAVDTKGYKLDVLSFGQDEQGCPRWDVWVENDTDDTAIFTIQDGKLNGKATNPSWECTLFPGTCARTSISWWTMKMDPSKFAEIRDAQFTVLVTGRGDDGLFREKYAAQVSYAQGGETLVLETEEEQEDDGLVLYETKQAKVVLTDIEYSAVEGYYILELKLMNNSAQKLRFESDSICLGTYEVNPGWLEPVPAGTGKECSIALDLSEHMDVIESRPQELDLHLMISNDDGNMQGDILSMINPSKFMMIRTESLQPET